MFTTCCCVQFRGEDADTASAVCHRASETVNSAQKVTRGSYRLGGDNGQRWQKLWD